MSGAPVGVIVLGHGETASALLAAARGILDGHALDDVVAIDAGAGETPELSERICASIESADRGRGVVLLVDLFGASPCNCVLREALGHDFATVSGLNLAMLLKLGALDRIERSPQEIVAACAASGERAVTVENSGAKTRPRVDGKD